MHNIIELQLKL